MRNLLILTMLVMLLSLAAAQINTYQVDQEMNITVICVNGPMYCSASSYCNINVGTGPDRTLIIEGQNMTYATTFYYYNFTPTNTGTYNVGGLCVDGSNWWEIDFEFLVTPNGDEINTGSSLIYILLTVFVFFLFCGSAYLFYVIPFDNKKNDLGKVILINKAKYLKLFMIPLMYGFFVWSLNLMLGLSNNYLGYDIFAGYMENIFLFFIYIGYGVFLVWIVAVFYQLFSDWGKQWDINKFGEALE